MTSSEVLTRAVRDLLASRGESQAALARLLGLPASSLTHRMQGKARWTVDELDAMAQHFGVVPAALLLPQQAAVASLDAARARRGAHTREYVHPSTVAA